MICNECSTKQCKHKMYQDKTGRFVCPDHTKPSGSWTLLELATAHDLQPLHDLLQQYGLKYKEKRNGRH